MKTCVLFIFTLLSLAGQSQNNINAYKYVLVPRRFDFFKAEDEYGLNSETKSLLEQKGFTVFWSNGDLPPAVVANRCAALLAEVDERKAFFTTNLTIMLKDCFGNIIFKSKEGKSREKEFNVAYDQALRYAFASLNSVPYKYDSTLSPQPQQLTATPANSSPAPASDKPAVAQISGTLYAQVIPNGYQLIDTTPKKVLTLLKTSMQDYFLAEADAFNGVVFKKNGEWLLEYYKDDKLVSQKLEIKF
ncbi:hypothetical protein [Puia dinghuensis]|uniref:Uncharacterized protein n=1 Tax=Puia dinghuensis TaxID=1792502 RepID=A0A8J2UE35_9BACT|nr:hypothetical protein [Puia dinghuensis]GGB03237.1 hypothetical protein GCM10011511_28140 [Puia dinghuensis]